MIKEFELEDGRKGSIEIDDKLVELLGEDWAEQTFQDQLEQLKKKIKSQE